MAAPTKPAYVKKARANLEPSTHGTKLPIRNVRAWVANGDKGDNICHLLAVSTSAFYPKGTFIGASNSLMEQRRRNDTSIRLHSTCGKVEALAVTFFI
jgi:hypothetical protein